jgi:hypothetical protein
MEQAVVAVISVCQVQLPREAAATGDGVQLAKVKLKL